MAWVRKEGGSGPFAVLALIAMGTFGGCRASHAGPAPAVEPAVRTVHFAGGTLLVERGACDGVDTERVREWADRAFAEMGAAWPAHVGRFRVSGLRMSGQRDPRTASGAAYGYWDRKRSTIVFRCGVENVVRHELFHVYCERAALPCDCKRIDHPDGFDLNCRSTGE